MDHNNGHPRALTSRPYVPRKPADLRNEKTKQKQEIQSSGDDITFSKNDTVIAVMGVTGAGKSTFISLLTDAQIEIGHGLRSCTSKVGVYYFYYQGRRIFLVDTPGFDDHARSDSEILKDVAFWMAAAYSKDTKLAGILYLHRISDVKMQDSALRNLRMFKQLCGEKNLKSVLLVTTHWTHKDGGGVPEDLGKQRTDELVQTHEFWGGMIQRGSRVVRHDNTKDSAVAIISILIEDQARVVLDIQDQLINQKRSLYDTDAAKALQSELIAERKKFQEDLSRLKEDMEEARRENDVKWQQEIRKDRMDFEKKISETYAETEALKTDLKRIAAEKEAQYQHAMAEMARERERHHLNVEQMNQNLKDLQTKQAEQAEKHRQQQEQAEKKAETERRKYQEELRVIKARKDTEQNEAVRKQIEEQRIEIERRHQEQLKETRAIQAAEERRWQAQLEQEREQRERWEQERERDAERLAFFERESRKSKGFFLDIIKSVCEVAGVVLQVFGLVSSSRN
ncbi:hypothetical protein PV11_03317 [Exophiala sideris]|uniref:G domain-containing protein n=1 Tax=Exophiala sideris TaxID=1016849 RepID=A0A0D1WG94_9EURO|nr:hypothetical protein PV11_03317 [Exophiala sideris]